MRSPEELTTCMVALMHDSSSAIDHRDLSTFLRRLGHEGFKFLSVVLPRLGHAFTRGLSGVENFTLPLGFKAQKGGCIPLFLGSAFRKVFNLDGKLLEQPCVATIRWLRTFLFFAYKVEVPYDETQIETFTERFMSVEAELADDSTCGDPERDRYRNAIRGQLADILSGYQVGRPKFGPGISSDVSRTSKYGNYVPPSSLRSHFGRSFFMSPNEYGQEENFLIWLIGTLSQFFEFEIDPRLVLSNQAFNTRVLFVPKDSRGPRVIGCEPAHYMWAQQAVRQALYELVETHPRTRGHVVFTDQTVNQKLVFDDSYATLDLKDASDRVHLDDVISVMPPKLLADMLACRSTHAELPNGTMLELTKFAPMGSALCFPVMALMIYTTILAGVYYDFGVLPSENRSVFVYGDDVIIPNEWADSAQRSLSLLGLKVNVDKSFVFSRFRESCGVDVFDSAVVTPLRLRQMPTAVQLDRRSTKVVDGMHFYVHAVALANSARSVGYHNLANELFYQVESVLGPIPYGVADSPYLCKVVDSPEEAWRNNSSDGYERGGKLRAWCVRDGSYSIVDPHGYARLKRNLSSNGGPRPTDVTQIGARKPYLSKRTYKRYWATAYA